VDSLENGSKTMAKREELLKEIGELAHYNEKNYFG